MSAQAESGCWAAGGGWTGAPFESAQLRFRRLADGDVDDLVALAGDEEVARWTAAIPHPYTAADAEVYLERARAENRVVFAIETIADGQFVGCVRLDEEDGRAEIGYWIGRPFWGRGHATEAVRRTVRFAFETSEIAVLDAEIMQGNDASGKVLEKAGFRSVGAAVGDVGRCDGVPTFRYCLEREDWTAMRAAKPIVQVVAVALVDPDGRVLMAKRPEGKKMAGLWEFPGGKVDPGETPEAALIRELDEELGIDTRESCLAAFTFVSHEYEDFRLFMPLYVCRVWQGQPQAREGQELAWVRPQRMRDYPMPPADVPLVAMLCDLL